MMNPLRECFILLTASALAAALSLGLHPKVAGLSWTESSAAEVSLEDVARGTRPVLWVYARPAEAYRQSHIPGAVSLTEKAWEQQLPDLLVAWKPGTVILVYCDSPACGASQAVAQRLQRELTLPDVQVLKGGWTSWQQTHR